jgi:putative cofactor-binding repeat protein
VAGSSVLSLEGTLNTVIDNCAFTAYGRGHIWNGYSWKTMIRQSHFLGVYADLGDAGAYFQFKNNWVQNGGLTGGGSGRQWLVDGNTFTGISRGQWWALNMGGSSLTSMTGLQISNNTIYLSDQLQYGGGIQLRYATSAVVTGNTIYGASKPFSNKQIAINITEASTTTRVLGNVITSANLYIGVALQSGSSHTVIGDNYLGRGTYGIYIYAGSVNNVVGCNRFSGKSSVKDSGNNTTYPCGHQ